MAKLKLRRRGTSLKSVDVILDDKEDRESPVAPRRLPVPRPTPRAKSEAPRPMPSKSPARPSADLADESRISSLPPSLRRPVLLSLDPDALLHDRFEDGEEVGRGGMGEVRRIFDRSLQRPAAIKILREGLDPIGVHGQRFIEEAQITGQLEHPNIVPVYDLMPGTEHERPSMIMKLVRGKTLRRVVEGLGDDRLEAANLERLVHIVVNVCDAVAFANEKGVVHCDIKPENIMLGRHGQVYVMDWGNASLLEGVRVSPKGQSASGTPEFMAPEQVGAFGGVIDARTDVFGLGGLLYFLLAGRAPRPPLNNAYEAMMAVHDGEVQPPEDVVADAIAIPPELSRIAMRCLAREPGDRYASADDAKHDLNQFLRGGGWLKTRRVPAGTVILTQGEVGNAAYVVEEGECEAYRTVRGKEQVLGRIGEGEVFGETAILTSKPRAASVRAVTDVVVKVITEESLERELSRNLWMRSLVLALAERFRELAASQ